MKELCPRFVHGHGILLEKQREIVKNRRIVILVADF